MHRGDSRPVETCPQLQDWMEAISSAGDMLAARLDVDFHSFIGELQPVSS